MTSQGTKRRILVVDDEPDIATALQMGLEDGGFDVDALIDPELVLSNFRPGLYDLVLVDIRMPKMDGFELYEHLKNIDPDVKVCFLTAVSEFGEYEQYRKEAYPKLGERHFVAIPISNDELIKKVNEMLFLQ